MKLDYIAAAFDGSGYGEASRNNILALHRAGVDVRVAPTTFEQNRPDLGETGKFLQSLTTRPPDWKAEARIVHLTPDLWESALRGISPLPTVGYAVWEASRVPPHWVPEINKHVRELWVPSIHNVAAFSASGVLVPVVTVPHCFAPDSSNPLLPGPRILPESTDFRFLSVMQWIERKNPLGLLKAYLSEFDAGDKVRLVLKTYLQTGSDAERAQIKAWIGEVKTNLRRASYPTVELITRVLPRADLDRLYRECDCYVSLHRGEGFGIPIAEAMLAGMPVITTGYGGPAEFVPRNQLVPWTRTPVYGMPPAWTHYTGDMEWAEPDLGAAREMMRAAFSSPKREQEALTGSDYAFFALYGYDRIGNLMKKRLEAML